MRSIAILLLASVCALILAGCEKCPDCAAQCADQCAQQAEPKRAKPTAGSDDLGVPDLRPATVNQIDKVFMGNSGWRTWTVFNADSELDHTRIGHAFRLTKTGNGVKLKPLAVMRGDWHKPADFYVDLEKVAVNAATDNYRYCGTVTLEHGDPAHGANEHGMRIVFNSEDTIKVQFYALDDPDAPDRRNPQQLCVTNAVHGGSAHAEN